MPMENTSRYRDCPECFDGQGRPGCPWCAGAGFLAPKPLPTHCDREVTRTATDRDIEYDTECREPVEAGQVACPGCLAGDAAYEGWEAAGSVGTFAAFLRASVAAFVRAPVPTVTLLYGATRGCSQQRYRFEGGEIAPGWEKRLRDGKVAWCEITIWGDDRRVSSFGGEVWPGAWPALFSTPKAYTAHAGAELTDAGWALIEAARAFVAARGVR